MAEQQALATYADYPPGFREWALWQIDLRIDAPKLDKQLATLLEEWQQKFAVATNAD